VFLTHIAMATHERLIQTYQKHDIQRDPSVIDDSNVTDDGSKFLRILINSQERRQR